MFTGIMRSHAKVRDIVHVGTTRYGKFYSRILAMLESGEGFYSGGLTQPNRRGTMASMPHQTTTVTGPANGIAGDFATSTREDQLRRPSDICVENLEGYVATCLGFSATSGLRENSLDGSITNAAYAVEIYERTRRRFQPEGVSGMT